MDYAHDADVISVGEGLLARTLPKPQWSHAAHFAAALWMLRIRTDLHAETALPPLIRAYNESTGVANTDSSGYHETITLASLRAARAFLGAHPHLTLGGACTALLATSLGRSDWLFGYWSRERLWSAEARRAWLDPDLRPLPF